MVFHWFLSDSRAPQVSRTLLSILADLNNALVQIVSIHPLISKSSSPCTNPLVTLPSAPIIIGITVTFMFHSFFSNFLGSSRYLSLFSLSFSFNLWSAGTAKFTIRQVLFFVEYHKVWSSGRDLVILCVSFSGMDSELCIYHLFVWSKLNFLFTPSEFLQQHQLVVFHKNLSNSKFPQLSRTFQSIRADLNNAVVWTVSILP